MSKSMKVKLAMLATGAGMLIGGLTLIGYYSTWQVALGMFLVLWASNIGNDVKNNY